MESTEKVLLPKFFYLCEDGVWGVRKACADVFMPVSCVCSPTVRKSELSPIFTNLLKDQSRWVRMTAYQALGPFISTFADSNITALLHNDNGEIVITDRELLAQRLEDLEKAAEETSTTTVTVKVNNPEEQVESMLLDTEAAAANDKTEAETSASEESKESSVIVEDKSDNSLDCDDATKNSTEEGHVINMDIEEDEAEDHRQMSPEATSPSPPLQPEVNNKEEDKHLRKIVHSKSLDDLSPEENRAKQYESSQVTANTGKDAVAGQLTSSESYNNFLYWRDPLPVLDDLDDLKTSEDAAASAAVNETVKTASTAVEETATTLDNAGEKKGALDEIWTGCPVITFQAFADLTDATDTSTMELFRPESGISGNGKLVFDPNTLSIKNNNQSPQQQQQHVAQQSLQTSQQQQQTQSHNLQQQQMQDPALPRGPPATLQSIVPQLLVDHFVSMMDPSRAQTVDSEIAHHCAFSLPAVALTIGRNNWPLLRETYDVLASDMQWKVRRTLASSIHELGIILGEEAAGQDLIPIFNGFLKDLDEVRIGLLKHLADFLKLLKRSDRKEYLPRLSEFLKMDNERNWRFREELANQIGHLVILFSPDEVKEHLSPIALVLLKDKVSSVRQSSVNVHTNILKYLLHGPPPGSRGSSPIPEYSAEDGVSLARILLAELVEELARVERWTYRQTYALLCHHIFSSSAMSNEQFGTEILHNLLDLAWDEVPNVRIVVARALHSIKETEYFTSEDNPHVERFEEAISTLKNDRDADVRSYFNPPPSLSTCGESTAEYFDSDGEPIGDVSSLP